MTTATTFALMVVFEGAKSRDWYLDPPSFRCFGGVVWPSGVAPQCEPIRVLAVLVGGALAKKKTRGSSRVNVGIVGWCSTALPTNQSKYRAGRELPCGPVPMSTQRTIRQCRNSAFPGWVRIESGTDTRLGYYSRKTPGSNRGSSRIYQGWFRKQEVREPEVLVATFANDGLAAGPEGFRQTAS
jgi:hypothetical protein